MVTLRGVLRRTATTFARASPGDQVGATNSVYRLTLCGQVSTSTTLETSARRLEACLNMEGLVAFDYVLVDGDQRLILTQYTA
ncbi:hypothetical protein [[Mycobacterium] nativiensis]|uniref:Uncharacterized protein n=1 Tax=[Mycobacterium] nativiensis TaxID=2855503 RepID=A0ABU5XVW9_9MYCO|nr:hypothetical protein [Mycolicibacter sp. MYC340]MEB3032129.1 hypothetical protein [Mycolicibacter sp. MYC340]